MLKAERRNNTQAKNKDQSTLQKIASTIAVFFITYAIIATNFLLYCKNGINIIFDQNNQINEYFLTANAIIAIFLLFFAFIFSFSRHLQNIYASIILGVFCLITLNQYLTSDPQSFLSNAFAANDFFNNYSHIIVALIFSFLLLYFLGVGRTSSKAYFAASMIVIYATTLGVLYIKQQKNNDIEVVFEEKDKKSTQNPKKFIYLSINNLSSYNLLENINKEEANLILGFFANNHFKLYPNAYVNTSNKAQNLANSLNMGKDDGLLDAPKSKKLFDFNKINTQTDFLKKAFLYDLFKQGDYQINAHQTNGLDICKINNQYAVNVCSTARTTVPNINATKLTTPNKVSLLISSWINSFKTGTNIALLNNNAYQEAYTTQTITQLKEVFANIKDNKTQGAYFINIDMPNSIQVFDSFCNIKPYDNWQSNKSAFFDQNKCLFATLQELITSTDDTNTVWVIASQAPNPIFTNSLEKNYANNFKANSLTTFAIKDPMQKEFSIDYSICPQSTFLSNYLFKKEGCSIEYLNLDDNSQKELEIELLRPFNNQVIQGKALFDTYINTYQKAKSVEQKN